MAEDRKHHAQHKREVSVSRATAALVLGMLVFLALMVWSMTRTSDINLHVAGHTDIEPLLQSMAGLTHSTIVGGNDVRILENGDQYFPSLYRDLNAAKHSIHFETFLWEEGAVGNALANLLAKRARDGIEVRVLVDGSGSRKMGDEAIERMKEAGVRFAMFHKFRIANVGKINVRDHRKITVVDGVVGYAGGHCITDHWSGNAQDKQHYRDTSIRLAGPIVSQLQSAFSENWLEATGEVMAGPRYFPVIPPAGRSAAHAVYVTPSGGSSAVEILHYLAVGAARQQIVIENPYFLPDPSMITQLKAAVRRGVDVRIILPAVDATDNAIVQHASHHHFGDLLKAGAHVYEYHQTLLHQKLMVVDGVWSSVGSTNFDDRSFELNDEITVGVIDPVVAQRLLASFRNDVRFAKERKFDEWSHRSLWHKLVDGAAYLINEQL